MDYNQTLTQYIHTLSVSEFGFSDLTDVLPETLLQREQGMNGLTKGVTIVVKLSSAVLAGIGTEPTHAYFHHYRTVNTHIDNTLLKIGMLIETLGYRYFPIGASQSITGYEGLFQHKTAARLAGLGTIGKNGLFLSDRFGPGVRLGTLLTNLPLTPAERLSNQTCGDCNRCISACPCTAINELSFDAKNPNQELVDRACCSHYMKKAYQYIGRGAVCGICMRVCPKLKLGK